jgi:Flp pilus assembly protein TadG
MKGRVCTVRPVTIDHPPAAVAMQRRSRGIGASRGVEGQTSVRGRGRSRGQSVVELALVLPILLLLLLAIADLARLYTTMLTVEAAAREAAEFGTLYPWSWTGDPGDPDSNSAKTVEGMIERACVATGNLTGYAGTADTCTNPAVTYDLDATQAGVPESQCSAVPRTAVPCNVVVTLSYDFRMILPVNIPLGSGTFGFPSTLTIERSSTFAISDFEVDQPLQPTQTP